MKVYGPYFRKDGRQHIVIVHDDGRKQTKSYPKYLLEQKLGRELVDDETCDHIDGDFQNNALDNLQVLSLVDNVKKSVVRAEMVELSCKVCGTIFTRRAALEKYDRDVRKKDGPFCSKQCVGKIHH